MTLTLTPRFRVRDDGQNVTLEKLIEKRTGEERWLALGYHTTLVSALTQALDEIPRAALPTTLTEAIQATQEAHHAILSVLNASTPHLPEKVAFQIPKPHRTHERKSPYRRD